MGSYSRLGEDPVVSPYRVAVKDQEPVVLKQVVTQFTGTNMAEYIRVQTKI